MLAEAEDDISNERILEILYSAVINNRDDVFVSFGTMIPYNNIFILFGSNHRVNSMLEAVHGKASSLNDAGVIQIHPMVYEVSSDGNCMYNSILAGIPHLEMTVEELRIKVFETIQADLDNYTLQLESQFLEIIRDVNMRLGFSENVLHILNEIQHLEEALRLPAIRESNLVNLYIDTIRQSGIWGGAVELGIISELLDIQIEVNRAGGGITNINNTGHDAFLVNLDYSCNHYNLIIGYELREIEELRASISSSKTAHFCANETSSKDTVVSGVIYVAEDSSSSLFE